MTYGGQAVIEGVMMRGKNAFAVAMRAPEGEIVVHKENLAQISSQIASAFDEKFSSTRVKNTLPNLESLTDVKMKSDYSVVIWMFCATVIFILNMAESLSLPRGNRPFRLEVEKSGRDRLILVWLLLAKGNGFLSIGMNARFIPGSLATPAPIFLR